jgi:release factor glutamine methyltransferase
MTRPCLPPSPTEVAQGASRRVGETLRQARGALASALSLDARDASLEAQMLLCEALGQGRAWLIAHDTDPVPAEALARFQGLLARRLSGEPVAYLLGRREFFGLTLAVTPAVLIPRPETERLVELALAHLPDGHPCEVLDLGTGSGAVALAIAHARPAARVTAIERSPAALAVAHENARRLRLTRVRFLQGDWFTALEGEARFHLIVANPPYVAEDDPHLAQGDVRFEPRAALVAGRDGLAALRHIVAEAPRWLHRGGWLFVEHGWNQGEACRALLRAAGFGAVQTHRDLAGWERVSGGQKPG